MIHPLKIISLKNQKEFDQVSKAGKKIHGKYFIMVFTPSHCKEKLSLDVAIQKNLSKLEQTPSLRAQNSNNKDKSLPQHKGNYIYLGLKVSRKMGNAVTRNKIKRWFKEAMRKLATDNPKYTGYSFILIPKKAIISTTYKEFLENIESQIKSF